MPKKQGASRRSFLAGSATGLGSAWLASQWPAILAAQEHAQKVARSGKPGKLGFFSAEQGAEVESVAAQIVPTDDTPGAREAGCLYFIDRALTTFDVKKAVGLHRRPGSPAGQDHRALSERRQV